MARFTELPMGDTGLILPSQQQTQQAISNLSNNLLQMRQYMEGEKDKRRADYVAATSFAIDPSITENAQRMKMVDDVAEYSKKTRELYKTQDSGYLRLNEKQMLEQQNLRNELVSKQAQRIAAQNAYAAQYKEFHDPKNRGLYKPDYFKEQAERFKSGEIVTDFLETYPIDTKKMLADSFKNNFKINMEGDPSVKNLGNNYYTSSQVRWSNLLLGDAQPTMENAKKALGEYLYNIATDPKYPEHTAISQDIATYFQKNPEAEQAFSDPEEVKKWLVKEYGPSTLPFVYEQKTGEAKSKSKGTTVNVGSGNAKPKTIYYNKTQDGYLLGGKHGAPIQFSMDVIPDYYIMDNKGNLVKATSQTPNVAETFKDAQINSIVRRGGKIYAGISKNKVEYEPATDYDTGKPITKKVASKDLDQTIYVPYDIVSSLVKQENYNLEPIEGFFDIPSIVN
jgi:hypothetical protein